MHLVCASPPRVYPDIYSSNEKGEKGLSESEKGGRGGGRTGSNFTLKIQNFMKSSYFLGYTVAAIDE